jgi:hypothetical protein
MKRPSLARLIEALALCVSATAFLFTLTIAVNASAVLVEQWPTLWQSSPRPAAADAGPAVPAERERTSKPRRRHRRAATPAIAPKAAPAKPVGSDDSRGTSDPR